MAVIVGMTEHLSPCRRRAAHEGKRHETRLALRTRMESLRHRLDSTRCRALLSCRLETNQESCFTGPSCSAGSRSMPSAHLERPNREQWRAVERGGGESSGTGWGIPETAHGQFKRNVRPWLGHPD